MIYMLNDLSCFRNTVVNDSTCEDRLQIKVLGVYLMTNGNVMVFRGYQFYPPKRSVSKYNTLGTSEAIF